MHLTLVKIFAPVPHTHTNTHTLKLEEGPWWLKGGLVRLQLSRVFSERVFTTNKDVNFFFAGDSYFYFELCTKCLFTPEKVLSGCPASGFAPSTTICAPCCRILFLFCRHRWLLLLAAVYFTALTIMSCPGSLVLGARSSVCPVLGEETSATSDTPLAGELAILCLDWCDQRTKYFPQAKLGPGHMTNDDSSLAAEKGRPPTHQLTRRTGVKASFELRASFVLVGLRKLLRIFLWCWWVCRVLFVQPRPKGQRVGGWWGGLDWPTRRANIVWIVPASGCPHVR